jgi:hypothetical protein
MANTSIRDYESQPPTKLWCWHKMATWDMTIDSRSGFFTSQLVLVWQHVCCTSNSTDLMGDTEPAVRPL